MLSSQNCCCRSSTKRMHWFILLWVQSSLFGSWANVVHREGNGTPKHCSYSALFIVFVSFDWDHSWVLLLTTVVTTARNHRWIKSEVINEACVTRRATPWLLRPREVNKGFFIGSYIIDSSHLQYRCSPAEGGVVQVKRAARGALTLIYVLPPTKWTLESQFSSTSSEIPVSWMFLLNFRDQMWVAAADNAPACWWFPC